MEEQISCIAKNGCIMPCPYRDRCPTYKIGCQGGCYWCHRYDADLITKALAAKDVKSVVRKELKIDSR